MKATLHIAGIALAIFATATSGFNLNNISTVAAVEGSLRTMATQCGDSAFAHGFTTASKALIAQGRLSTKGVDPIEIESDITDSLKHLQMNGLYTQERCARMMPDLKQLYQSRLRSLQGGQK